MRQRSRIGLVQYLGSKGHHLKCHVYLLTCKHLLPLSVSICLLLKATLLYEINSFYYYYSNRKCILSPIKQALKHRCVTDMHQERFLKLFSVNKNCLLSVRTMSLPLCIPRSDFSRTLRKSFGGKYVIHLHIISGCKYA